jgi:hypothetical protein
MEALMASMRALGDEEKRPPHMELAPDLLASSDTVFHPALRVQEPLPQVKREAKPLDAPPLFAPDSTGPARFVFI